MSCQILTAVYIIYYFAQNEIIKIYGLQQCFVYQQGYAFLSWFPRMLRLQTEYPRTTTV